MQGYVDLFQSEPGNMLPTEQLGEDKSTSYISEVTKQSSWKSESWLSHDRVMQSTDDMT